MEKGVATKENHYAYNKTLRTFARSNRNTATKAEACLWKYVLRAGMMKGYTFRRQRPVMRYIADFMCKELMLVIEVDGFSHHFEETIRKDRKKQHDLEEAGFTVLRFADEEVLHDIENVRRAILFAVETKEQQNNLNPSPSPPRGGG
jgi:very-short-patch-repair endonuclease